ncbi:hypothetical protein [Paracoccus actinidiae]|uniref:hypothetical protein n=1 Tax=Paracoccus actinidiae TaxID=3064531 RepID=UPI0027D1F1F5|nr:hypothetical protein [Paracoccus sp. M09]
MITALKNKKLADAEFSKDMVETILQYFETYSDDDGVLTVEVREHGLWVPNPVPGLPPQFIGLARMPAGLLKQ